MDDTKSEEQKEESDIDIAFKKRVKEASCQHVADTEHFTIKKGERRMKCLLCGAKMVGTTQYLDIGRTIPRPPKEVKVAPPSVPVKRTRSLKKYLKKINTKGK